MPYWTITMNFVVHDDEITEIDGTINGRDLGNETPNAHKFNDAVFDVIQRHRLTPDED